MKKIELGDGVLLFITGKHQSKRNETVSVNIISSMNGAQRCNNLSHLPET